jgi:hypothetical protein
MRRIDDGDWVNTVVRKEEGEERVEQERPLTGTTRFDEKEM